MPQMPNCSEKLKKWKLNTRRNGPKDGTLLLSLLDTFGISIGWKESISHTLWSLWVQITMLSKLNQLLQDSTIPKLENYSKLWEWDQNQFKWKTHNTTHPTQIQLLRS
jgi:hypothetical protein